MLGHEVVDTGWVALEMDGAGWWMMDTVTGWSPDFVDDVLAAMRAWHGGVNMPYPYEVLADQYPPERVLALMDELEDAGITESGVSLRTGWVRDYLPDIGQRIAAFKASGGVGVVEAPTTS